MWKNKVEPNRPQMTIKYGAEKKRFACRINKARTQTHTHTTIRMVFRRQEWFREPLQYQVIRTLPFFFSSYIIAYVYQWSHKINTGQVLLSFSFLYLVCRHSEGHLDEVSALHKACAGKTHTPMLWVVVEIKVRLRQGGPCDPRCS
jgi:hypothetical protein